MQLVFGRYAILNIKNVANWEHIRQLKQLRINHNTKQENMWQNNHQYKVGETNLVNRKKNSKHELEFMGPFPITQKMTLVRFAPKRESSMMPPIFAE